MKEIDYEGSLVKDFENLNNQGKKWDIILVKIANEAIAIAVSIPIVWGLNKLIGFEINWAVSLSTIFILDTISAIRSMIKSFKERETRALEAEGKIRSLAYVINLTEEEANNLTSKVTFEGLKDAITTKEEDKTEEYVSTAYGVKGHKKKTSLKTTNFYLLDNDAKLRVLREIRKEIQENNSKDIDTELYLLEEDDIPSYVPVVKTLERK